MPGKLTINGKDYAVIPMAEYQRLTGRREPALPDADAKGRRPAREAIRATVGHSIMQRRLDAGLSQKQLASRAGISAETLSRIEAGKHRPQAATIDRLAAALGEGE